MNDIRNFTLVGETACTYLRDFPDVLQVEKSRRQLRKYAYCALGRHIANPDLWRPKVELDLEKRNLISYQSKPIRGTALFIILGGPVGSLLLVLPPQENKFSHLKLTGTAAISVV